VLNSSVAGGQAAAGANAVRMGFDASANFVAGTRSADSIHFGAAFRPSSGGFMMNAAAPVLSSSHQRLKLLLVVSPRCTIWSALDSILVERDHGYANSAR
jgi:hypothetical protein